MDAAVTAVPLLRAWQDYHCPNCGLLEQVAPPLPPNAQRWHTCPRLHMLKAPLVLAGMDCKVVAMERQDYLNGEQQRTGDDGKPYSAVLTVRGDGSNDAAVFAGVAVARLGDVR